MGYLIYGQVVVKSSPGSVEKGTVYSVNFEAWLEIDEENLKVDADAPPDITGFIKWDGCINWNARGAHGCGPEHAETVAKAIKEAYRQAHRILTRPDFECPT